MFRPIRIIIGRLYYNSLKKRKYIWNVQMYFRQWDLANLWLFIKIIYYNSCVVFVA